MSTFKQHLYVALLLFPRRKFRHVRPNASFFFPSSFTLGEGPLQTRRKKVGEKWFSLSLSLWPVVGRPLPFRKKSFGRSLLFRSFLRRSAPGKPLSSLLLFPPPPRPFPLKSRQFPTANFFPLLFFSAVWSFVRRKE